MAGCGDGPPPAQVEGTLWQHGKPLERCLVTFLLEPGQQPGVPRAVGVTDERGYYQLHFDDQRSGASIGWHRVLLYDTQASSGIVRVDRGTVQAGQTGMPTKRIPPRFGPHYNSERSTPLKFEVKPGVQRIDIRIE